MFPPPLYMKLCIASAPPPPLFLCLYVNLNLHFKIQISLLIFNTSQIILKSKHWNSFLVSLHYERLYTLP